MNCFFSFLSPTATITEGDYLAVQDKTTPKKKKIKNKRRLELD
jgi:hypothetical protein